MATETLRDPDFEWLDMLQPTGLVVGRNTLRELGLIPERQTQVQSAEAGAHIEPDTDKPALKDHWGFVAAVLGWEARHVAGSPAGPALPENLLVRLPEHDTTLAPTWAVKELGKGDQPWQLLVRIETSIDPDKRRALVGWEASAHQRFERLLRETAVFAGLMITDKELRLVYAPRGETSGWLSFPIRALKTVAGRPMLGGLKVLLDSVRLFTDADQRRLPALLKKSRDAQAAVSTTLAEQVLGALHEMLRGLDAADPPRMRDLARTRPDHLYEGLLTVLMRLVFILYAEDRDLLPSRTDERARELYENGYSVRGLYGKLTEEAALNPDTMDERRGGWGRLLALFRLIHKGHKSHFVQARGGKLFDPDVFPFLEGRDTPAEPPRVLPVSDGCILRVLGGLMTLKGPAGRERLSYRTLDVEQIGSVYETVMGFTVEAAPDRVLAIKAGKNNRTPVFVALEKLVALKGKDRIKYLKEDADRSSLSAGAAKAVEAAKSVEDMIAALDPLADERGSPRKHAAPVGTPILQPTDERRRTGSHYTPRSLTEPIVRYALEPAFDRLGSDATPEQILDLKVCDPAMGSGAFLVEAGRAIAAKLVKAWELWPEKKPTIPADEDENLRARRLVAQRCLYGVDKNPLATDLAKLSLWLATLARDHEFTFLDHALKSGDSLVGLNRDQIAAANWDGSKSGLPLFRKLIADRVAEAMKGRTEIQAAPDDIGRAIQEQRYRALETRLKEIHVIGDALIAAFFAENKPKAREKRLTQIESWLTGSTEATWASLAAVALTLKQGVHPLNPFHWEVEFPEIFTRENGGFDAIVGNPPFLGAKSISTENGIGYRDWLSEVHKNASKNVDLIGHFFTCAFRLARKGGTCALIASNTIAQGDTREGSLAPIIAGGGIIYAANKRLKWPGEAAVVVSLVHIVKGPTPVCRLNGRVVKRISAFLVEGDFDGSPARLATNFGQSFQGSTILGMGFTFDDGAAAKGKAAPISQMRLLIEQNKANALRIFPYIGGEELNTSPRHEHRRFVINISDLSEKVARKTVPDLWSVLEEFVRPERQVEKNKKNGPMYYEWWKFWRARPDLYAAINRLPAILALSRVSPQFSIARLPRSMIFADSIVVFAFSDFAPFAALQSRPHEHWARSFSSSMKDDLRYAPSDCFETFPSPPEFEVSRELESGGGLYHNHRASVMTARNEGMTKTYNRFHNPIETAEDIQRLRELHAAMDRAVLKAYDWHDLAARAEPIFLDESNEDDHTYQGRLFWPSEFRDEVLSRLLSLNAERHAEEVHLGTAPGLKSRKGDDEEEDDFA